MKFYHPFTGIIIVRCSTEIHREVGAVAGLCERLWVLPALHHSPHAGFRHQGIRRHAPRAELRWLCMGICQERHSRQGSTAAAAGVQVLCSCTCLTEIKGRIAIVRLLRLAGALHRSRPRIRRRRVQGSKTLTSKPYDCKCRCHD